MRRTLSILFYLLGGWFLSAEMVIAFIDPQEIGDPLASLLIIGIALIPAIFLLLGAVWISPSQRCWGELGFTLLIVNGILVFTGAMTAYMFCAPDLKPFINIEPPPMKLDWIIGFTNLGVLAGIGWILYKRGSRTDTPH